VPVKHTFRILNGATPQSSEPRFWDGDIAWATPEDLGNLIGDTLLETGRKITAAGYENCGTTLAPPGSLVLSTRAPIGHLAISGTSMCTNQGCRSLVFKTEDEVRFFYYLFCACRPELQSLGRGSTFVELSRDELASMALPVPPIPEQRAIATFLDRETARIDVLIGQKERLIVLLEEKRQAVISHAVTRGLDPAAPLKDSGVPWLGMVPKHWRVLPLKRLATRVDVGIAEASTHAYQDDGVPIIRSTNVRRNLLDTSDLYYIDPAFAEKNRSKYLRSGDLVTTRTGANLGMTAVVTPELDRSQCFTLLVATLRDPHHPRFYCYLMNAVPTQFYFLVEGWGAGQHNLSVPIIQEMPVPIPPPEEQKRILDYILRATTLSEELVAKIQHGIARLQEYRTALISAAVTGQIDVRGEVTGEPAT
jgi:type I restriction enzyme S subunit